MNRYAAIYSICNSIVDALKLSGTLGTPSGVIFVSLMQYECTLDQYKTLLDILVKSGRIRQQGDLLFAI